MATEDLFGKAISEEQFSRTFCEKARLMNFQTVDDILIIKPQVLILLEGFTYAWLGELCAFLMKNKSLHLLQPIPGSIDD